MRARYLKIAVGLLAVLVLTAGALLLYTGKGAVEEAPLDIVLPSATAQASVAPQPAETAASSQPVTPQPSPAAVPTAQPSVTPQPSAAPNPLPAASATPKPSATPQPTKEPSSTPDSKDKPLQGITIGVDPGHQAHSNHDTEPVAPGSSTKKAKVSSGTYGRFTGIREHEVNLAVGLLLRDMLKDAGATVVMTRTKADVDISNVERAQIFNKKKVDLGVRLHCNGSDDPSVAGAFMLVPKEHPYKEKCAAAAKVVLAEYGKATGISVKKGITYRSDQTGFNWCERPVINIEMGHMTNKEEDFKLTDASFQKKMAKGIYNGILRYFTQED